MSTMQDSRGLFCGGVGEVGKILRPRGGLLVGDEFRLADVEGGNVAMGTERRQSVPDPFGVLSIRSNEDVDVFRRPRSPVERERLGANQRTEVNL
jgi:hypothetical protein